MNTANIIRIKKYSSQILIIFLVLMIKTAWGSKVGDVDPTSIKEWKKFREAQPFQMQVIAISSEKGSIKKTLIISEPPQHVTWEKLADFLTPFTSGCEIKEWFVMSGGSVKDVVCTLRKDTNNELAEKLANLQLTIYGTTESTPIVALPVPKRHMIAHSLDYRFSAHDLYRWLMDGNQEIRSSPIAPNINLQDIFNGNLRGVYWNSDRSLVFWVIDRSDSLNKSEGDIRRFAFGSDLILGAVAKENTVVIVGRGRIEPLAHLPPLRSETILLLAGSTENQLAQSYERNDILAGPGIDGVDRAPILLSPQLIDTELGTLLNVADQLLKNWSMAGTIEYSNFKYPSPKAYPFGEKPVAFINNDRADFLFNWNTDGATYLQKIKGLDVVVPQRTGSLSIIYGDPLDRPRELEATAYDYFALSGDTSLARVLQYTLIYQIFRQFDISATKPFVSQKHQQVKEKLRDLTHRQLSMLINDVSGEELQQFLHKYWSMLISNLSNSEIPAEIGTKEDYVDLKVIESMLMAVVLREANQKSEGKVLDAMTEIVTILRGRGQAESDKKSLVLSAKILANYMGEELVIHLIRTNFSDFRDAGLLQITENSDSILKEIQASVKNEFAWNSAAFIVESDSKGIAKASIGGHNINAPIIHFKENMSQMKGTVTVERDANNQLIVMHSVADRDRVREIARQVGTRKELSKIEMESGVELGLKSVKPDMSVPFQKVSAITGKEADFRLLNSFEINRLGVEEQKILSELSAAKQDAIIIEQQANGGFVLSRTGSPEALHVASITAATDALANGLILSAGGKGVVSVLIKGVPDAKAEAMLSFVQSNLRRYNKETVDHVLSMAKDGDLITKQPVFVNTKIAHNGIRIEHNAIKVEKVASGTYKGYSRVEIPVTIQAKTPILLRFYFYIKDLTAEIKAVLLNKISMALAQNKKGSQESIAEINNAVRRQLREDLERLGIDSLLMSIDGKVPGKVHDVIIGNVKNKHEQIS